MRKLVCLTTEFFSANSLSINYHLVLLLKGLPGIKEYEAKVYSYEPEPKLTEKAVLHQLNGEAFADRVTFQRMTTMSPKIWASELENADVLLCQHYSFAEILQETRKRKPEIKIVSWIHSIVQEEFLSGTIISKNDAYPFIRQQNLQVKLSDHCIIDSRYDYDLGRMDFRDMKRARVIWPVTEMGDFRVRRQKNDAELFREGRRKLSEVEILFIGRWDYRKGLDSLIPCSFRMYMEYGVKTVLLTDGGGDYVISDNAGRRQYEALRKCGGLRFERWKSDKQEYTDFLCEKRWVAVLPSYYDPFNLAAYDCAALGIPLLVSNRCGVCEIFTERKSIAVCNPYDMEELYQRLYDLCRAATEPLPAWPLHYGVPQFECNIRELFGSLI